MSPVSRAWMPIVSGTAALTLLASALASVPAAAEDSAPSGDARASVPDGIEPAGIETVGPVPVAPAAQGQRWPSAPQGIVVLPRGSVASGDQPWLHQPRFADIDRVEARVYDITSGRGDAEIVARGAFEQGWWRVPALLGAGRSYGVQVEKRDANGRPTGAWQVIGTFNVSAPGADVGPSRALGDVSVSEVTGQAAWAWQSESLAGPAGGVRVGLSWRSGQPASPGLPEGWRVSVVSGSPWAGLTEGGVRTSAVVEPELPAVSREGLVRRVTLDYPTAALAEADAVVVEQRDKSGAWRTVRRIDAAKLLDPGATSDIDVTVPASTRPVRVGVQADGVTVYSPSAIGLPARDPSGSAPIDGAGRNSLITAGSLPEIVTLTGWDGSLATYVRNPLGVYEMAAGNAVAGFANALTRVGPGQWEFTDAEGVTTRFSDGHAVSVEARGMKAATMVWDAEGRLVRVVNEIGRTIDLGYAGSASCANWSSYGFASAPDGSLCSIGYPGGVRTDVGYVGGVQGGPQIALVKAPGNVGTALGWDSRGRLVATRSSLASRVAATVDPAAAAATAIIEYDARGRVATFTDPAPAPAAASASQTLAYPSPSLAEVKAYLAAPGPTTAATSVARVTDAGNYRLSTTDYLDPVTWRTVARRDASGRMTTVDPAADGRIEWSVSADGLATRYEYNDLGAVIETKGPFTGSGPTRAAGNGPVMSTVYDAAIDGTKATPWTGLRAQVYPLPQFAGSASAEYWEADRGRGGLSYSWKGRDPASFSAQASGVWTPADAQDRRGADQGWAFRVAASSDADVSLIVAGKPCVLIQGACEIKGLPSGPKDVVVQVTRASGDGFFGVQAAPVGEQLATIPMDEVGPGYLLSTQAQSNDVLPGSGDGARTITVYDDPALGQASRVVGPGGLVNRMAYEGVDPQAGAWGRMTTKTSPGGRVQTTEYWPSAGAVTLPSPCTGQAVASGQAKTIRRPDGTAMTMYYDIRGREIAGVVIGEAGATQTTCMSYDDAGAQLSAATYDTEGALVERTEIDHAVGGDARVTSVAITHGPAAPVSPGASVVSTRTMDLAGREVSATDFAGTVTDSAYDVLGNPTSRVITPPAGAGSPLRFAFAYSARDAQLSSLTVNGVTAATLAYDDQTGRLASAVYPDGVRASFTYSGTGAAEQMTVRTKDERFTAVIDGVSRSAFGRIEGRVTEVIGSQALARSRTYSYDAAGRLASAAISTRGAAKTVLDYGYGAQSSSCPAGYSGAGLDSLRTSGSRGGIAYATCYDALGRAVSTTDPAIAGDGRAEIEYDAFGRITGISGPRALALEWTYGTQLVKVHEIAADGSGLVATTLDTYGSQILDKTVRAGEAQSTIRYAGPFRLAVVDGAVTGTSSVQYPLPGGARVTTAPGSGATLTISGVDGSALVSIDVPSLALGSGESPEPAGLAVAYGPYGEPLGPEPAPSALPSYGWKSAMGQETLAGASSITLIGARGYSPLLGQFLAPDPDPEAANNSYSYTSGDPINTHDPDGHEQQDVMTNVVAPIFLGIVSLLAAGAGGAISGTVKARTAAFISGAIATVTGAATGFLAAQGMTDDVGIQVGAAILGAAAGAGLTWGSYRLARGPSVASQKKAFWAKLDKTKGREPIMNDLQFEVWQKWDAANPGVVPISNEPIVRANRLSLNPFSGPTQGVGGIPNQKWLGHEWIPGVGYADPSVPRELAFKEFAAKEGMWSPY